MRASDEYGDHVHRSPSNRHRANRERWNNRATRRRAERARQQEREQRERDAKPNPPQVRCVCLPDWCLGIPGESDACTPCVNLDPQSPCLLEVDQ